MTNEEKSKLALEYLEMAKKSENVKPFESSHYFRKALMFFRDIGDSANQQICKTALTDQNQKAAEGFEKFTWTDTVQQCELDRILEGYREDKEIESILMRIGLDPLLCPPYDSIVNLAKNSIPVTLAFVSLTTQSPSGHLLPEGSSASEVWFSEMYKMNDARRCTYFQHLWQFLVTEKGLTLDKLLDYIERLGLFDPEDLFFIKKGLERFFSRDYVSSIHILIPRIENVFMKIAAGLEIDSIALDRSRPGELVTREKMMSSDFLMSSGVSDVFGRNFCGFIDFLLTKPLGHNLRNRMAHGDLLSGECSESNCLSLIYMLLIFSTNFSKKLIYRPYLI
ncbi:MAG: DUF4209 domain-containing protein [Candidatus Gracilibacteria bacterium]